MPKQAKPVNQSGLKVFSSALGKEPTDFDHAVEQHLVQHEANFQKMHAAETGGATIGLGPTQMEQAQIKQRNAIQRQSATQGAAQAQQAQASQAPAQVPESTSGPMGSTTPFTVQKGAVGGPGNAPQPSQPPTPPPPEEGEDPAEQWPD